MEAALEAVLATFLQIAQLTGASSATTEVIAAIVTTLLKLIPVVVDLFPKLVSTVKGVISALEANPAALPDQIAALKAQLPADDSEFDDAVKQAEANDDAAAKAGE
jgi:hypothetical protein